MRRRIMWAGGILLALAAAFTILLFTAPEAPPFPFLRGHERVPVVIAEDEFPQIPGPATFRRVYSFQADFDKLIPIVERDLAQENLSYAPKAFRASNNRRVYLRAIKTPPDFLPSHGLPQVSMYRDVRATKHIPWPAAPGWVTFVVDYPRRPSMFDNLRAWLGL